jgi:H+/Na+-translocating ferredoxin:NAD+ oxidoreductase subunit C
MKSLLARKAEPANNRRSVFDFHGGIHPPENKTQSNSAPIQTLALPPLLILPLNMHIGAPAKPIINVGDHVLKGQKLADANGMVSVPVHAPTSGTITAIGPRAVQHPSGLDAPCIVLQPDGQDRWTERHPIHNWRECSPSTLITRIREAGVTGMGGAGFPSAVKVNLKPGTKIQQLLINAVECEPYITADDLLMRERAADIVHGIHILQHLIKPHETLIGIEDNKPLAIAAMRAAIADTQPERENNSGGTIEVVVVPTKYPSGGEKQLVQLLTGKEVPSSGIPAQVGVVCQNIGTALAMYRAIAFGEPLISRITTITGDAVTQPGNVETLIGTPVSHLLNHAGVNDDKLGRIIMGGPMMGFTLHALDIPVVKTSNCVIAASREELPEPAAEQPCIRCGSCAEVCPADLLPQQLYWYSKTSDLERAQQYNLMDCIECGACAYVCPSNIPLVQYYRFAKGEVRHQVAEQNKADKARERFEARQARIDKELAEKEARRQARLEASKQKALGQTNAATSSVDVKALKAASLEASSAYKAAVKALKSAQAEEADVAAITALSAQVDQLKAKADNAKAAVRDAASAAPSQTPPASQAATEMKALKSAALEASSAYKAAVKVMKAAEENGADDIAELRAQADALKSTADAAKAAVRDANTGAAQAVPVTDPVEALKKAVMEASSAYKAAVKSVKEAELNAADNLAELRGQADTLKGKADQLKADLRDAKAAAPSSAPKAAPKPDSTAAAKTPTDKQPEPSAAADPIAERAVKMKALKTAYNSANKIWKEANAALERGIREGAENIDERRAKVDLLRARADSTRAELNELVDQAKAGIRASGSDLKSLKIEAARAESALGNKIKELEEAKKSADEERINVLYQERDMLKREAELAANALKSAVDEQGLSDA